jgi:hypothetical protein
VITFEVYGRKGNDIVEMSEADLAAAPDAYLPYAPEESQLLDGALVLHFDGQPRVDVVDGLLQTAQNLCFGGTSALAADPGSAYTYRLFSAEGLVTLTPEGDTLRFACEQEPEIAVARAELLPRLFECGERILAFAELVPGQQFSVDYVRPFAAQARHALEKAGLIDPRGNGQALRRAPR